MTIPQLYWPAVRSIPPLEDGATQIWSVALDNTDAGWQALQTRLADDEIRRAARFVREPPRRRFVAARAALRTILAAQLSTAPASIRFVYSRLGKPLLDPLVHDADVRFNVAHSGGLAVIAVTRGCDVGIDVEQLRRVRHGADIVDRWFHTSEIAAYHRAPTDAQETLFFRCWTRKEAIVKALGTGLQFPLAAVQVPCGAGMHGWIGLPAGAPTGAQEMCERCWLESFEPCPGYIGAVSTLGQRRTCRYGALVI